MAETRGVDPAVGVATLCHWFEARLAYAPSARLTGMVAVLLFVAALAAGVMNALAGGGSFLTFPALLLAGLDTRAANITSTIALFPGQISTSYAGCRLVQGSAELRFRSLFALSLAGGAVGAALLLATPATFFARLVPWLVLFATLVFA